MNKFIIYLMLLLPCSLQAQAQQKTEIYGKIFSADGKPVEGITVKLLPQDISVSTKANGSYLLKSLKPGPAQIHISAIGVQSQIRDIQLEEKRNIISNIYLNILFKNFSTS